MGTESGLTNADAGILSEPFIFHRNGSFYWYSSGLSSRGSSGNYWSGCTYSTNYSHYLLLYSTYLGPQYGSFKGHGFAVRCVEKQPRNAFRANKVQLDCFSGSHSFQNLFVGEMGMETGSNLTNGNAGVLSNPLSFEHSGGFGWYSSGLNYRGSGGFYWSGRTYGSSNSRDLYFLSTSLNPRYGGSNGNGYAVRCVAEYFSVFSVKKKNFIMNRQTKGITYSQGLSPFYHTYGFLSRG